MAWTRAGATTPDANLTGNLDLGGDNGHVRLFDGAVDKLGYGTGNDAEGGAPATGLPGSGPATYERKANTSSTPSSMESGADALKGNAYDSDNNAADFVVRVNRQPRVPPAPKSHEQPAQMETPPSPRRGKRRSPVASARDRNRRGQLSRLITLSFWTLRRMRFPPMPTPFPKARRSETSPPPRKLASSPFPPRETRCFRLFRRIPKKSNQVAWVQDEPAGTGERSELQLTSLAPATRYHYGYYTRLLDGLCHRELCHRSARRLDGASDGCGHFLHQVRLCAVHGAGANGRNPARSLRPLRRHRLQRQRSTPGALDENWLRTLSDPGYRAFLSSCGWLQLGRPRSRQQLGPRDLGPRALPRSKAAC